MVMIYIDHKRLTLAAFTRFEVEAVSVCDNVVTIEENDDNAEFFTIYGRMDVGSASVAVALVDCCTRTDAETGAALLTEALPPDLRQRT